MKLECGRQAVIFERNPAFNRTVGRQMSYLRGFDYDIGSLMVDFAFARPGGLGRASALVMFVGFQNNQLSLESAGQYRPNKAPDKQPQGNTIAAVTIIDRGGPTDEKQPYAVGETENHIHLFSLHDVLRMELVGLGCGLGLGGFFGFLLGRRGRKADARLDILQSDSLRTNCNKGRQHERC